MADETNPSRPCYRGECDRHPHQPCDHGWLGPDRVCPCWSARRRLVVNHTAPPDEGRSAPMPMSVRAAWATARADARPLPRSKPEPRPSAPGGGPAVPAPLDPRAADVVSRLGLDESTPDPLLLRLAAAIAAALDQGWRAEDLVQRLDADRDPDREPARYWIWCLGRIGRAPDVR